MRFFVFLSLTVLIISREACAQKTTDTREQIWTGYFNQTRLTDRSGMWVDLQFRMNDYFNQKSLSIARLGYTYYVSDPLRLTAGYGYITHYPLNSASPNVPENRLWQQVQWFDKKESVSLSQYFRIEERFVRQVSNGELTDDSKFTWRFRYNFAITLPLKPGGLGAGAPFVFLNDELHINAGKNVVNNYFDQNRLFAGVGYQFTADLNAQVGYLFVFQQLPSGNEYVAVNALRLFVFHNLDFRK